MKKTQIKKKKVVKKIAKAKVVKATAIKSPFYFVTLQLGEQIFERKGASIVECLDNIVAPYPLKNKGIFTIKFGKLTSQRVLYPFEIKRLLARPFNKQLFEKRMLSIMK